MPSFDITKELQRLTEDVTTLSYLKTKHPVTDDMKIRVYHGFYNAGDAISALKHGLSGKERARRVYSYESGNNPKGLFVSVDFNTVKRNFAGSGFIIEFDTLAGYLEAPVWKGQDTYFVQGQYTQSFANDEERQAEQLRKREKFYREDPEGDYMAHRVSKSDRPELAASLFGAENQALFIGNLNPEGIKYVWYNEVLHKQRRTDGEWKRYPRKEFMRKFGLGIEKDNANNFQLEDKAEKIFKPNDHLNLKKVQEYLKKRDYDYDRFMEIMVEGDPYYINRYFWPRQIEELQDYLKRHYDAEGNKINEAAHDHLYATHEHGSLHNGKKPIRVYRLEHYKTKQGPFNFNPHSCGLSGVMTDYIHGPIADRYTEKVPNIYYDEAEDNIFAYIDKNDFLRVFTPNDLKYIMACGWILNTYETYDYKFLNDDQVIFNPKTAKLVEKGERLKLSYDEMDALVDDGITEEDDMPY